MSIFSSFHPLFSRYPDGLFICLLPAAKDRKVDLTADMHVCGISTQNLSNCDNNGSFVLVLLYVHCSKISLQTRNIEEI